MSPLKTLALCCLLLSQHVFSETKSPVVANHYTLYCSDGEGGASEELVTIFSKKATTPSFTIQYGKDGVAKLVVQVESETLRYFYEDTDGDGIFDKGICFDKKSQTSKKFLVETKITFKDDKVKVEKKSGEL